MGPVGCSFSKVTCREVRRSWGLQDNKSFEGKRCSESLITYTRRKDQEGQSRDNDMSRDEAGCGRRLDSQHRHSGNEGGGSPDVAATQTV